MKNYRQKRRRFDLQGRLHSAQPIYTQLDLLWFLCRSHRSCDGAWPGGETLYRACVAVLFAMIFDAVDGRVARSPEPSLSLGFKWTLLRM